MGIVDDILKGLPENSVLRGKVRDLATENTTLKDEIAALKDDKRQLETENERLKEQIKSLAHKTDLHEIEVKILRIAAEGDEITSFELAQSLELPEQRVQYHLQELETSGYLDDIFGYPITQKGRKYLIDRGLL